MESLTDLIARRSILEEELDNITIKNYTSTAWNPGVMDQHKSESYSYDEYTDATKAYRLKEQIANLNYQIYNYAELAQNERKSQEALKKSQMTQYEYTTAGKTETTTNPAIAARSEAQKRFYGMNKLQQTMLTITGQKKKFKQLWMKAVTPNKDTQEQVADELNKMFR